MNWLIILELLQIIATVMMVVYYEKTIAALIRREKAWGDCMYAFGYNDGRNARKAQPKTKEDVLSEAEEKE